MQRSLPKLPLVLVVLCFVGCANVARIEKLPSSPDQISFDDIAKRPAQSGSAWNLQTEFDYYLEVEAESTDRLHTALVRAFIRSGYEIVRSDKDRATVLGQRGLRLNEWNTVAGAYYRSRGPVTQVYVRAEITQDITGGLNNNRAQEIGDLLCSDAVSCVTRR